MDTWMIWRLEWDSLPFLQSFGFIWPPFGFVLWGVPKVFHPCCKKIVNWYFVMLVSHANHKD